MALMVAGLIPAALAMACNPQAYLTLDKTTYAPGDTVRVSGSFFKGDTNITVSVSSGLSATVRTTANGAFSTTFALPANAAVGGYSVSAVGFEPNGDVINGLPARGSFSVAVAAPAAPAASTGGGGGATAQPATAAAAAPQPSAAVASRPSRPTSQPSASSGFREPGVINEPNVQSSSTQSTQRGGGPSSGSGVNGDNGGADRASSGGRAVFGGSVAPAVTAPTAVAPVTTAATPRASATTRARSNAAAGVSARTAERTATDDVWGALTPGRAPSVLPIAGDGVAVSSPRPGSQLALGVLLLGIGALSLVGGLAAGEARRRRVRVK